MSQVQVGAPDLKNVTPAALAVANFLRHHELLKQRQAILNGKRQDFFRVKRAIRALESPQYAKAQKKSKHLPEITNRQQALEAFRLLPLNRLAFRVEKLDTEVAVRNGLKPAPGVPVVQIVQQQEFGDDMYYVWFHEPVRMITYVYAVLALLVVFAVVLFPLWPMQMRVWVSYLSMGLLGLIGAFFGLAAVRLIVFSITWVAVSPGLWIFPNLFEDVSVIDSFKPLYSWHGQSALPDNSHAKALERKRKKQKKEKKQKKLAEQQQKEAAVQQQLKDMQQRVAASTQGSLANMSPAARVAFQAQMRQVAQRVELRKQELAKTGQLPTDPQQVMQFTQQLFGEELRKSQAEFQARAAQAGISLGQAGQPAAAAEPKIVPVEDEKSEPSS